MLQQNSVGNHRWTEINKAARLCLGNAVKAYIFGNILKVSGLVKVPGQMQGCQNRKINFRSAWPEASGFVVHQIKGTTLGCAGADQLQDVVLVFKVTPLEIVRKG